MHPSLGPPTPVASRDPPPNPNHYSGATWSRGVGRTCPLTGGTSEAQPLPALWPLRTSSLIKKKIILFIYGRAGSSLLWAFLYIVVASPGVEHGLWSICSQELRRAGSVAASRALSSCITRLSGCIMCAQ